MTDIEIAAALSEIAERVRRLPPPSHRNPECFFEARSELGHELDELAERIVPRGARHHASPATDRHHG